MNLSFTKHPHEVGESYAEHVVVAAGFGTAMIVGGLACLVHGLMPFLFTSTGSRTIMRLHEVMVVSRQRMSAGTGRTEVGSTADQRPAALTRRSMSAGQ